MWDLTVSVLDHCLSFYFDRGFDKMTNLTGLTDAHCLHCLVCGNFILSETMEGRPIFTCKPGNIVLKTTNNY